MINTRTYIVYDFETGSLNPHTTQPLELAAIAVCPRTLEIIPDSLFHSRIKPLSDSQAKKKGLDTIQKSALDKNKLDLEELKQWPDEKTVWQSFVNYTYQWNVQKDSWNSLISVGFNIDKFDCHIIDRLAKTYGPWDDKKSWQKVFNPIESIDIKKFLFQINENNPEIDSNSMDAVRKWLGKPESGFEHRADEDVKDIAHVFMKCQKLIRYWSSKTVFKW